MASNYSAGQFDDAFNPKRLRNWEIPKQTILPITHRFNSFIANGRGHLLPHIPRSNSPWGNLTTNLRRKERNLPSTSNYHSTPDSKYPIPKMFKKPRRKLENENVCEEIPTSGLATKEDVFSYLRQLQLPVIWIIGLPTKQILSSRRNFCRQLAQTLEFIYINLDEKIDHWLCHNKYEEENNHTLTNTTEVQTKVTEKRSRNVHHVHKQRKQQNNRIIVEASVRISSYPNEPNETPGEPTSSINKNYDSRDPPKFTESIYQMSIELSDFCSREKIVEMLAFSMLESVPTAKGFVLEGFPYDRAEAAMWEKDLYPSALALYFMEGPPQPHRVKTESRSQKAHFKGKFKRLKSKSAETNDTLQKQKKLIPLVPKYIRRFLPYSLPEAERVCEKYEHKLIRVVNAEDVLFGGLSFLSCLVQKALSQYSNILQGKTIINYDSDTESNKSYMSSRAETAESETPKKVPFIPRKIQLSCGKRIVHQKYNKLDWIQQSQHKAPLRKRTCSSCHKPIRKVLSNVSISSSVKPKTPPFSYEYCLPTPSLYTVGDPQTDNEDISISSPDTSDDDEYIQQTESDKHNYTPLSWGANLITEDITSTNQDDSYLTVTTTNENAESQEWYTTKDDETCEEKPSCIDYICDHESKDIETLSQSDLIQEDDDETVYLTDESIPDLETNEIFLTSDEEWESVGENCGEIPCPQRKAAPPMYQDRGDVIPRFPGESGQGESILVGESGESHYFAHSMCSKPRKCQI